MSDSQIILVYEIASISNTDSNATSFTFNPNLLYLKGDNGDDDYAATSQAGASGLSLAGAPFGFARTQTVPAGSTRTVNAAVVVTDTAPNGSSISDWNKTDFRLLYATPAGSEGVLLVKTNGNAAGYAINQRWGCTYDG